jgi:drug/metabolite transporter (DMT)-like permease
MNKEKIGLISLWVAIVGLVISVIPGTVFIILINKEVMDSSGWLWLCIAVFFVSQIIALSTGIVARHTPAGKAGLIISAIGIFVAILIFTFLTPNKVSTTQARLVF